MAENVLKAKQKFSFIMFMNKDGAIAAFVLLLVLNCIITTNFFSLNVIYNLVVQGSVVIVISLGMTLAISSGGFDISVGSVMAVSAMVTAKLLVFGILPAILIGLATALAIGFFNGFLISYFKMQPIIVTLSMLLAVRGLAELINHSMIFNFDYPNFTALGRSKFFGQIPVQFLIIAVVVSVMYFIIKKTSLGIHIQATGDNQEAVRLSGVNVILTIVIVYGLSSLLAGFAGIMETTRIGAVDPNNLGKLLELDAIAAVALGGTPMTGGRINFRGTVIAALVMQLIVITVNMNNIPVAYSYLVKSIILIVSLIVQQRANTRR